MALPENKGPVLYTEEEMADRVVELALKKMAEATQKPQVSPSNSSDLLCCPFCGGREIEMWPMDGFEAPVCTACGATICENYTGHDTELLIAAWNTRAI